VKAFLIVCALAGVALGVASSCGPQQSFCPNNPPVYNCINNSEAGAIGGMGGNGSACEDTIFICNGVAHCGSCT
jgi:hypothetical protein